MLDRTVPAVPSAMAMLRRVAVEAYEAGGGDPALSPDVALGVSEATANAVRHAYPDRDDGTLTLRGWFEDGLFVVQVLDRGVGIDTPTRSPGTHLGVALIEQLAEAQFATREGGGTEARLAFPLRAEARAEVRPIPLPDTIFALAG